LAGATLLAGQMPPASDDDDSGDEKKAGTRRVSTQFIEDKSKRQITFSKRKTGIMKKVRPLLPVARSQDPTPHLLSLARQHLAGQLLEQLERIETTRCRESSRRFRSDVRRWEAASTILGPPLQGYREPQSDGASDPADTFRLPLLHYSRAYS